MKRLGKCCASNHHQNTNDSIYIKGTIRSICINCVGGDGDKKENGYECND